MPMVPTIEVANDSQITSLSMVPGTMNRAKMVRMTAPAG